MAQNQRISQFTEQGRQALGQVQNRVGHLYDQTGEIIRGNPGSSVLLTFGLGFGVGLLLTALMMPPARPKRWYETAMPEWMSANRGGWSNRLSRLFSR